MGIRSWWFYRGVQSALFYYISFAPCLKFAYSRRRNAEMKRAQRAARASQHAAQSDPEKALPSTGDTAAGVPGSAGTNSGVELVKPIPYSSNIYWTSDMEAGPSLPDGWRSKKVMNQRRKKRRLEMLKDIKRPTLNIVVNREAHGLPRISVGVNTANTPGSADVRSERTSKSERTVVPSPRIVVSDGVGGEIEIEALDDSKKDQEDDGWNLKLYQRPTESLWGLDDALAEPGLKRKRSSFEDKGYRDPSALYSAHIPAPSRTAILTLIDPKEPPIVKPASMHTAREVQWMTQPPPSAKFMEGKARRDATLSATQSHERARRLSRASENTATSNGSVRVVLLPVEEGLGARPGTAEGQSHDRHEELLPALDLSRKKKRGRMRRKRRESSSDSESSRSDSSASFDIPRDDTNGYFDMHSPAMKTRDGKGKERGMFSDILSRVRDGRGQAGNETELREMNVNVGYGKDGIAMQNGTTMKRERWSMDI